MEDALAELVRNAVDAGATRVFVASSLKARRYRTLSVIDDGPGLPMGFKERIFEPGVTSRHLAPAPRYTDASSAVHGAGLSLYHIREAAISAKVLSNANPTAIQATFDTRILPERSLQTGAHHSNPRTSRSNLPATLLATSHPDNPRLYYASPSRILATLLQSHIIPDSNTAVVHEEARRLGLGVSRRTVQRVRAGLVRPAGSLGAERGGLKRAGVGSVGNRDGRDEAGGTELRLGEGEIGRIQAILEGAARASYLEVGPLKVESRVGGIVLRASVYEPEEIYEP